MVEIITGVERRHHWLPEEKLGIFVALNGPEGLDARPLQPQSCPFFRSKGDYAIESQWRSDADKWKTMLGEQKSFRPGPLKRSGLKVEYHASANGRGTPRRADAPNALAPSVIAPGEPNLYNRILIAYRKQFEGPRPIMAVSVSVRSTR